MGNRKLELLLWKKYPKNKPKKVGLYLVQWEDGGIKYFSYDYWERECLYGDLKHENYYWLTLEHCNVVAFTKTPKGVKYNGK